MRVSVVGTGYVGTVTAAGLAEIGNDVVCVDLDLAKVEAINDGTTLIYEVGLDDLVARNAGKRLRAVVDTRDAVGETDLTLIAVDTPFGGEEIDLSSIEKASAEIGRALRDKPDYHVVVVKSTVVPGTTEAVVLPILEENSGKTAGADFGVGMNPEFLREGQAVADFLRPDRIVLGGIDERTRLAMAEMYRSFVGAEIFHTDTRTAELIKYASNSLLATLISYSNELANLASKIGVDSNEVMRGVHLDRRLTPMLEDGSRLEPGILSYLLPGCGFGGSCFPKDVRSLIAFGSQMGASLPVLEAVMEVNETQPQRMVELLKRRIPDLSQVPVAILGVAFKPGTDDVRESPAIRIAEDLLSEGATVTIVDPVANDQAEAIFGERVAYEAKYDQIADSTEAFLLVTAWPQFAGLPDHMTGRSNQPVMVDGRRFFSKKDFTRYEGIGL